MTYYSRILTPTPFALREPDGNGILEQITLRFCTRRSFYSHPSFPGKFWMWFLNSSTDSSKSFRDSSSDSTLSRTASSPSAGLPHPADVSMSFNLPGNDLPISYFLNHCSFYYIKLFARWWLIYENGSKRIFLGVYFNKVSGSLKYLLADIFFKWI